MTRLVAWLVGFVVVFLLCAIFAPKVLDQFFEVLGSF